MGIAAGGPEPVPYVVLLAWLVVASLLLLVIVLTTLALAARKRRWKGLLFRDVDEVLGVARFVPESPETTSPAPAPDPRQISSLRRLALFSILLFGVLIASEAGPLFDTLLFLAFACLLWWPHLLLWRRRPEGQKRALAWVLGPCILAPVSAALVAMGLMFPPGGRERQTREYVALFASLLLTLNQAAVLWKAGKTFRAVTTRLERKKASRLPEYYMVALIILVVTLLSLPGTDPGREIRVKEMSAQSTLRALSTAQRSYAETWGVGFTDTLSKLGEPESGQPNASHADLVDPVFSGQTPGATATSFTKSGCTFVYTPGAADADGRIRTYVITARPEKYEQSGRRSFFTDQTCVMRATGEDRAATARDEVLQ